MNLKDLLKKQELGASSCKTLVDALNLFKTIYSPSSVFYPCCGGDTSPSEVFPNVTFVDTDERSINLLKAQGLNAYCLDARNYKEEHDLILLLNPQSIDIYSIPVPSHLIANDWHQSATKAHQSKQFELLETVTRDQLTGTQGFFEEIPRAELTDELDILDFELKGRIYRKKAEYYLFRRLL